MIDILITTYNRLHFLKQTIETLLEKNTVIPYSVHVIDDGSIDGTREYLSAVQYLLGRVVLSDQRQGVVTNFNYLWDVVMKDSKHPYLCYLQDDLASDRRQWLSILLEAHQNFKDAYNAEFSSAYDAPEHPALFETELLWGHKDLKVKVKRSTSGQNLFAEKTAWLAIGKPPIKNLDGSERGFPNDGRGSNIDVWFTGCYSLSRFDAKNSSPNSLYGRGKNILVVPMLRHLGIEKKDSTWRQNRSEGF